ncbi:hypothetical protein BZM27_46900 [Paraburkholderia steynii]|uniref:Uncharacterized protein n=1 Tax=Paraburkholderia steynii TaxID=1245441 RepID=A0A4V2NG55_9BURK|nr:hypothetical protein BZM27_46900 [Paraburkholderia steynii]
MGTRGGRCAESGDTRFATQSRYAAIGAAEPVYRTPFQQPAWEGKTLCFCAGNERIAHALHDHLTFFDCRRTVHLCAEFNALVVTQQQDEIVSEGICGCMACLAKAAADATNTARTRMVLDRPENVMNMMNLRVNLGSAALGRSRGRL